MSSVQQQTRPSIYESYVTKKPLICTYTQFEISSESYLGATLNRAGVVEGGEINGRLEAAEKKKKERTGREVEGKKEGEDKGVGRSK
jgi:hypothetical protein